MLSRQVKEILQLLAIFFAITFDNTNIKKNLKWIFYAIENIRSD